MSNSKDIHRRRKEDVWKKSSGRCAHCGKETKRSRTVDHYIPKSRGGGYDRRNLVPLCSACNRARGSKPIVAREYYQYLSEWAFEELEQYEREFNEARKSMEEGESSGRV